MTDSKINVRVGEVKVGTDKQVLFAIGLGSCVGVALYDPRAKVGGLAHVMLPYPAGSRKATPPGRFAVTAIEYLIDHMLVMGAERRRITARLVGGAAMFETVLNEDGPALGSRNADAAREALKKAGIPLGAEETGGNHGRTVHFYVEDGRIVISTVMGEDLVL